MMSERRLAGLDLKDGVGVITLDNPPVNALSSELVQALREAAEELDDLAAAGEVRAAIIAAEGKNFCAGADLKERAALSEEKVVPAVNEIRKMVDAVWNVRVPVIAAVKGVAYGGGMELALAADIRVVTETALLGLKETALAIIPGAGGTQRLERLVGIGRALEWIVTARSINADEALASGLANRVVRDEDLFKEAMEMASIIAGNGPVGVQAAKRAVREGHDLPFEKAMEIEWHEYLKTIHTEDRVEGLNAFLQKRRPDYKGR